MSVQAFEDPDIPEDPNDIEEILLDEDREVFDDDERDA